MSSTTSGARRRAAARRKRRRRPRHHWVHDRLQSPKRAAVAKDMVTERRPIHRATPDNPGKRLTHRRHRRAPRAQQFVDHRVGLEHRHPEAREAARRRGLSHADGAGEPEDDHRPVSPATTARNRSVTAGVTPNQAAKPGRAWCSSIPRPSAVRWPRARAAARSGVSSGT